MADDKPDVPPVRASNPAIPLAYEGSAGRITRLPRALQAILGFCIAFAASAITDFVGGYAVLGVKANGPLQGILVIALLLILALVQLAIVIAVGRALRPRWPLFLPAAVAGWAVASLLQGLCACSIVRSSL